MFETKFVMKQKKGALWGALSDKIPKDQIA
jgi:hypothetical protein